MAVWWEKLVDNKTILLNNFIKYLLNFIILLIASTQILHEKMYSYALNFFDKISGL